MAEAPHPFLEKLEKQELLRVMLSDVDEIPLTDTEGKELILEEVDPNTGALSKECISVYLGKGCAIRRGEEVALYWDKKGKAQQGTLDVFRIDEMWHGDRYWIYAQNGVVCELRQQEVSDAKRQAPAAAPARSGPKATQQGIWQKFLGILGRGK